MIGDGEHSKFNWMAYARARLEGLAEIDSPVRFRGATRNSIEFAGAYDDLKIMHTARSGALVAKRTARPRALVCAGPIRYVGHDELYADIANLKASLAGVDATEAFMTAISPSNLELYYENRYYASDEEYLLALGEAMRVEYLAITDAGFVLQIDDPRMATHYNRQVDASIEECRKFIALRVEMLNHALRGIPEDRIRFHTCYSVNIAPRVHDFELKHFVDLMLKVRAGAYRHRGGESAPRARMGGLARGRAAGRQAPDPRRGLALRASGRASGAGRATVERFAGVVGRERVIAGTDCGFGTSGAGDEVHPDVAWAKLRALVEGARIASRRLWT